MINQNEAAEIRTCERVKFDQALYILTMYEKKIRVQIPPAGLIDAQKLHEDCIVHSWHSKWKMDLTKPILNCVTSVEPRVFLGLHNQDEDIEQYNQYMLTFIRRMRAEHEDESNFKLIEKEVLQTDSEDLSQEMIRRKFEYESAAVEDFLTSIQSITTGMLNSIELNSEEFENLANEQYDTTYALAVGESVGVFNQIVSSHLENKSHLNAQLLSWISGVVHILEGIKESEHGSTLMAAQPCVGDLTYLIHPLLLPIYANLLREKGNKKKEASKKSEAVASMEDEAKAKPFKSFFVEGASQLPKVVFLNLDGFESEYNLEFARSLRRNLMYISFPKEDVHSKNENNLVYEKRFYKKLMYNQQKDRCKFASSSEEIEEGSIDNKIYYLLNDIEDYFKNVEEELFRTDKNSDEINKNLFVFPLRLKTLEDRVSEEEAGGSEYETIDVMESYEVVQLFRYFLVNQIREFNPTCIMVSHSGRLRIEDNHFVEIMQQLTKLSQYKVIYFPNLTPHFYPSSEIDHEINTRNITYLNHDRKDISSEFFNKIARFLKVTSGTHSLTKNFEPESLLSKHRHSQVLCRMNRLMEALGQEYEHIERIRFKNKEIDLIPKLFEDDTKRIIKGFEKLVPRYYSDLYDVLKAIVAVQERQADNLTYQLLKQFNIDPKGVEKLSYIMEMVWELKERICLIREQEAEKNLQIYKLLIKQIETQRIKHFLEIAEERYEDSILLYFKILPNHVLYAQTQNPDSDGKPSTHINLTGLVDVSFAQPKKEPKEVLRIYDSTQVLYTTEQSKGSKNTEIPVLIMNHLPLDKKLTPKFDNYCAFLNRDRLLKSWLPKGPEEDKARSAEGDRCIHEEKKVRIYPIRLLDHENQVVEENRFEFRVSWNYAETQRVMVLYWPLLYNMFEAVSLKMQSKSYQPPLINEIYIAKKEPLQDDCVKFYRANIRDDIAPRTGCSAYALNDNNLYIFGGFYDQGKNYLELQSDVTRINLGLYDHEGTRKVDISNMKSALYEKVESGRRPNSFVRARREYEFFEWEDLDGDAEQEERPGMKRVVMIGGYGQNFIHPFSMLTYYYYILEFNEESGALVEVRKELVYNRAVPINMRAISKNMGIIKTSIRNKSNSKPISEPQMTDPGSYARFRVVYSLSRDDSSNRDELNFKFQFIFSEVDCRMLKEELRKLEEDRYEVRELSHIRFEKIEGSNHHIMIEKSSSKMYAHLKLEASRKPQADEPTQAFKLTHESISNLNIINGNYICAILRHPIFTDNKSLVAECKVKTIQNDIYREDETPSVCLRPITQQQLPGDLTLHVIEATNINIIHILHGFRLRPSDRIHEYSIMHNRKDDSKKLSEIKPVVYNPEPFGGDMPRYCLSTFFSKKEVAKYEIVCESYICLTGSNLIYKVSEAYNPESTPSNWYPCDAPAQYVFVLDPKNPVPINIDKLSFQDFWRQGNARILVVQYNKGKFFIVMDGEEPVVEGTRVVGLRQVNEVEIRGLEEEDIENGSILVKKPVHYYDRGYIED